MALSEFISDLSFDERRPDLSEGTLVMCSDGTSCWHPRIYVAKGETKFQYHSLVEWPYIVPLEHFHPDSPEWLPSKEDNWGNFGKQEKADSIGQRIKRDPTNKWIKKNLVGKKLVYDDGSCIIKDISFQSHWAIIKGDSVDGVMLEIHCNRLVDLINNGCSERLTKPVYKYGHLSITDAEIENKNNKK